MTVIHRLLLTGLGALLCISASSCSTSGNSADPTPTAPSYTPVADAKLYAEIGKLPGVSGVDIAFDDSLSGGNGYVGALNLTPGSDPVDMLDHVIAILRQGRPAAGMTIEVHQPDRTTTTVDLPIKSAAEPYLTERYGPQPGNGKPPNEEP